MELISLCLWGKVREWMRKSCQDTSYSIYLLKSDFPVDRLVIYKESFYSERIGPFQHSFLYHCIYKDRKLHISVQFSRSVVSDSLRPHELQHARPPCPSPTPGVHSNSHPLILWCHPAISSSVIPFSSFLQSLPASESFPTLRMRWPKYWSFSFSIIPSKEIPGLISFRMDLLDLLAVQGTQESSPTPQFKSINFSALSFLHSPTLTSIHDHRKNHNLD